MEPLNSDFLTKEAQRLEETWKQNLRRVERVSGNMLLERMIASIKVGPDESAWQLVELSWFDWRGRRLFRRYYASMTLFVWRWALREAGGSRAENILESMEMEFLASGYAAKKRMRTMMADIAFFDVVLDDFRENGFLSVAHHVVLRILGNVEKRPQNLEVAVGLSLHMDQMYEKCRAYVGLWSGM